MPEQSRRARTTKWMNDPETIDYICVQVANGGSLLAICEERDIRYSDAVGWIYFKRESQIKYEQALNARGEWMAQKVLDEVRRIGTVDIRRAYDDDGKLLDVKEMPEDVARCIQSVVVTDTKEGQRVTIKLADKLRALELLGKQVKLFTDRLEIHDKTLEDLVRESYEQDEAVEVKPESKEILLPPTRKILDN